MAKDHDLAQQLFGQQPKPTALEAVKEAVQAIAPGLDGQKMAKEIGSELHRLGVQGLAELAAGLFSGANTYVPYGPGQAAPETGLGGPALNDMHAHTPQQQDRGGHEL